MQLCVGNISIKIDEKTAGNIPEKLNPYICKKEEPATAKCSVVYGKVPASTGEILFDPGFTWRVEKCETGIRICMLMGDTKKVPYSSLELNNDLTMGTIYLDTDMVTEEPRYFGLRDPLHELWVSFLLMQGRGILVHCLGVLIDGEVSLFTGKSATGKSTLANVFKKEGIGTILSDDRVIVRMEADGPVAYGTPWHGEAQFSNPSFAPLKNIYFLHQSPTCELTDVDPLQAVTKLFSTCFLAGWPQDEGIQNVLSTCEKIASSVLYRELGFTPDKKTLEILDLL